MGVRGMGYAWCLGWNGSEGWRGRRAPENPSKGCSDSISRSCYKNMRFTGGFSWDLEFSFISPAARHLASVRSHLRCKFEGLARDESKMSDSQIRGFETPCHRLMGTANVRFRISKR